MNRVGGRASNVDRSTDDAIGSSSRFHGCLLVCLTVTCLATSPPTMGQSIWDQPVGRRTVDDHADLITALIKAQQWQTAKQLCQRQRRSLPEESAAAATWTASLTRVLTAQQLLADDFDEAALTAVTQPIETLLASYPQHELELRLRHQLLLSLADAARHDVLVASTASSTTKRSQRAIDRLLKLDKQIKQLNEDAEVGQLGLGGSAADRAMSINLLQLRRHLSVLAVQVELLQSQTFPSGSSDRIGAAARSARLALDALSKLPSDATARVDLIRLRSEALLETGDSNQASSYLEQSISSLDPGMVRDPAAIEAVRVRIDLAKDDLATAMNRLVRFFGRDASAAPASNEMDLAMLSYLIKRFQDGDPAGLDGAERTRRVTRWLDQMESRGGPFARRRGEAMMLQQISRRGDGVAGPSDTDSTVPSDGSAMVLAAQGQDWLRRGDRLRGGGLLAEAARFESDGDMAIKRAIQAAAALLAETPSDDAVESAVAILSETADRHRDAEQSANAQLQAAVIAAKYKRGLAPERLDALIRSTITSWPDSKSAESARDWLIKRFSDRSKWMDAALVATDRPGDRFTAQQMEQAWLLWQSALSGHLENESAHDPVASAAMRVLRPLQDNVHASTLLQRIGVLMLDRESLRRLLDSNPSWSSPALQGLAEFRRTGLGSEQLGSLRNDLKPVAAARLMADGRSAPQLQESVVQLIESWQLDTTAESPLARVERMIWIDQVEPAIKEVQRLVSSSESPGKILTEAAAILGQSDRPAAKRESIALWDRLAAGLERSTEAWHQAKLAAAETMARLGDTKEASKRAQYILLTAPPTIPTLQQRYQALVEP
ncbi:MAG: hypothetical protein AAGA03_09655 [Planctomycetota bacterium]